MTANQSVLFSAFVSGILWNCNGSVLPQQLVIIMRNADIKKMCMSVCMCVGIFLLGLVVFILLFTEKLMLSEPDDKKRKKEQDSDVKEAKRSKRGKRAGKNKDTPEERAETELSKVMALKARLAKKKDRPNKIRAVIDHKAHDSRRTGKA